MEQSNFHCKNYFPACEITKSALNRDDYQVYCVLIYIGLPGIFTAYRCVTKRFMNMTAAQTHIWDGTWDNTG